MATETAESREEAETLGFYGIATYPSPLAGKGTLKGVVVNSDDAPDEPTGGVSGAGRDTELEDSEKVPNPF